MKLKKEVTQMGIKTNEKTVHRFNKGFIVSHWVQAISFFGLYLTGLPLYTEFFDFLFVVFGSPETARILHRTFAVAFILPLFILILFDRQGLKNWAKRIFTWRKNDFMFFIHFPKEFFVGSDKVPKQDFFNAGEKLNSFVSIITSILLIASGFILWFPANFSQSLVQVALATHVIGFSVAILTAIAHIFLSALHPNSKASLRGIVKGDVPISYAKDHHGQWYDELVEQGVIEEDENKSKGA